MYVDTALLETMDVGRRCLHRIAPGLLDVVVNVVLIR